MNKLLGIQACRGMAALLVLLYHAQRMLALQQYVGHPPLGNLFAFGNAGVDFFFVLSGFIIYFAHRLDLGRPDRLFRYVWRRIVRIYPIYWVVLLLSLSLSLAAGKFWNLGPGDVLLSMLLIHHDEPPVLGVAWTLEHEMLFYGVFAIAIFNRGCGIAALAVWGALIVTASMHPFEVDAIDFLGSAYHAEFFLGIASAVIVYRKMAKRPVLPLLIGGLAFCGTGAAINTGIIDSSSVGARLLFGASSSGVLIGLAALEQEKRLRVAQIWAFLGACSYSLYLIHTTTIGLTARLLMRVGVIKTILEWCALLAVLLVSVCVAAVLYLAVERPLMNRLSGKFMGPRRLFPDRDNVPSRI